MAPAKKAAAPAKKATKKAAKKPAARKAPPFEIVEQERDDYKTHWYKINGQTASGRGVTNLLGNGFPKAALKVWAAKTVAACALDERDTWEDLARKDRKLALEYLKGAPDRDRDEAANRGQEVHELADRIAQGEEVEVPEPLEGMVDQYLDWRTVWEPLDEANEVVGYNATWNYLGRFDLLAGFRGWFPDEPKRIARILVDYKTNRSGIYPDVGLQLAAYRRFEFIGTGGEVVTSGSGKTTTTKIWEPEPMPHVDGMAVLWLNSGSPNEWQFLPIREDLTDRLFATFLHAVRIAEFIGKGWRDEDKGWQKEVLEASRFEPFDTF